MIRVSQLKLPVEHSEEQFYQKIEKSLKIKRDQIKKLQIVKKSIDARKKPEVSIVYSVDVWVDKEEKILKHSGNKNAVCVKEKKYKVPESGQVLQDFSVRICLQGKDTDLSYSNAEKKSGSGQKMFYTSGKQAYWIRHPTCSLAKAVQERFQTEN